MSIFLSPKNLGDCLTILNDWMSISLSCRYLGDCLTNDLDVVQMLEREDCIAEIDRFQLRRLFPQAKMRATKMLKRHVGFVTRQLMQYIIEDVDLIEGTIPFSKSINMLFIFACMEGRVELAKHFFSKCESPILAALVAAHSLRINATFKIERDKQVRIWPQCQI